MTKNTDDTEAKKSATGATAIVGSGLIGRSWAIVFAKAGWHVKMYDVDPGALDNARDAIVEQLRTLEAQNLCTEPDVIFERIEFEADLGKAVQDVDYVQECGPENVDIKRTLFADIDKLTGSKTILASSTSGILASQFSEHLNGRHRILIAHPVNPPHLIPLVEISPSEWTDPEVTQAATDIMSAIGQSPIIVQKEIPGFILNRLQGALLNEAMRLAEGGYATPDDIDKAVRDGLGLRWSFMGPFETIDLNAPAGLADYAKRYGQMYHAMAATQAAPPDWSGKPVSKVDEARRALLSRDDLEARQNWRDGRLAALIAHKRQQEV